MRYWRERIRNAGMWIERKLAALDARDWGILTALALVWYGLADVWKPLAPLGVGAFLLWFTTVRRVPE